MNRRIIGGGALLAALALLVGCASSADTKETPEAPETEVVSELTGTLNVAAAASLQPAFEELSAEFTKLHPGVEFTNLTFDGSSVLATQIIEGAPIDVFASADQKNMDEVGEADLLASEPVLFATSSLQIAVAPGNPLGIDSLDDLVKASSDGTAPVVVVCSPEVPCGAASKKLLDRDGVALTPASEEQNVTAVLTKVAAGEADAGLIYRSDVLRSDGKVEGIEIEGSIEAAGSYLIAPVKGSKSEEAAQAFSDFMLSDEAQALFEKLGFGPA